MKLLTKNRLRKLGTLDILQYKEDLHAHSKSFTPTVLMVALQECKQVLEERRTCTSPVEALHGIVRIILRDADLEGLLRMDCPKDEYDNEAGMVLLRVAQRNTIGIPQLPQREIAGIVADVFNHMFHHGRSCRGEEVFLPGFKATDKPIRQVAAEIKKAAKDVNALAKGVRKR